MQVIPVIDLKSGQVVHARRGERDKYLPIESRLCRGSLPADVVRGLLGVHPFAALYIADLDAIQGHGSHADRIVELHQEFPGLQIWVDCGLGGLDACRTWLGRMPGQLVLGSEAVEDPDVLRKLRAGPERLILSLDYRDDRFIGPPDLLDRGADWPARIIVMTLSRVGSDAGPDFARLAEVKRRAGGRQIFAAGGVRGGEDLLELARRGVSGVLVATALHDQRIGRADILAAAADPA